MCYYDSMKIGIFDSGLGGLLIAKAIHKALPQYDYVYLGDTKRVPYGNRSHETVYEFTREAVKYLFEKENCMLIVIACNTASARALRKIQQEYLPKHFPERKVLGVLIPAAQEAGLFSRVGIIGTQGTIQSKTFPIEIGKINPKCSVFQNPAPMLVPLAEEGEEQLAKVFIQKYLSPFKNKNINALILGCTHYPLFKKEIRKILPAKTKIISQDEIVPKKLKEYLARHTEIDIKLSKKRKIKILVTNKTKQIEKLTEKWFGNKIKPSLVEI